MRDVQQPPASDSTGEAIGELRFGWFGIMQMYVAMLFVGMVLTVWCALYLHHQDRSLVLSELPGHPTCLHARFKFPGVLLSSFIDPFFLLGSVVLLPSVLLRRAGVLRLQLVSALGLIPYWLLSVSYLAIMAGDAHPFGRSEPTQGTIAVAIGIWFVVLAARLFRTSKKVTLLALAVAYGLGLSVYFLVGMHATAQFISLFALVGGFFLLGPAYGVLRGMLTLREPDTNQPRVWPPFWIGISFASVGFCWGIVTVDANPDLGKGIFIAFGFLVAAWFVRGFWALSR